MKLKLSTDFLSDKQVKNPSSNENDDEDETTTGKGQGKQNRNFNSSNSNKNNNNNEIQHHQMIERHGVYKMDSGISLMYTSTRQDILILVSSAVCHFEEEQEDHA